MGADVDTRSLTYAELAEALGITAASAKRLAIRRAWPKSQGNDGKARVMVPVDRLDAARTGDDRGDAAGVDAGDDAGAPTGDDTGDGVTVVSLLREQVGQLQGELAAARTALDAERLRAGQVDVLKALLAAEARRVEDLQAERDRWAAQADRLIPLAETTSRPRPWWPFKWSA